MPILRPIFIIPPATAVVPPPFKGAAERDAPSLPRHISPRHARRRKAVAGRRARAIDDLKARLRRIAESLPRRTRRAR